MNTVTPLRSLNRFAARMGASVEDVFLLALRLYVSWQFLKSGWLKLQDWDTTRFLFEEEYHVPLLSPSVAAVLGTAGELVFPLALAIGLLGPVLGGRALVRQCAGGRRVCSRAVRRGLRRRDRAALPLGRRAARARGVRARANFGRWLARTAVQETSDAPGEGWADTAR